MRVDNQIVGPSADQSICDASNPQSTLSPALSELPTIPNFRDVGEVINAYNASTSLGESSTRRSLRTQVLYRGARPGM